MLSSNPKERIESLNWLINNFHLISDKEKVCEDIHRLTMDTDIDVRWSSTVFINSCFSNIPDKNKALEDLHRLVGDKDVSVRWGAAYTIISIFSQIPDKNKFWKDMITLTADENDIMQGGAASSLGSIFMYTPNKLKAWNDLHNLVFHKDLQVRIGIAYSLGKAFPFVPNKYETSKDLQVLMHDYFCDVRTFAADSIGSIFSHIPDKKCVWQELIKLKEDEENDVRIFTNHSLGRICVFKASKAKTDQEYKKELNNAITFFEQASISSRFINPSKLCLPFYRSFYTIIFSEEKQAQKEIKKYLTEAKNVVVKSRYEKLLFKVIENLAYVLREIQNFERMDLNAKKDKLNFCRIYCEQSADLLSYTEKTSPYATELIRKGLPIFNRKLKYLLEEIQEKAETSCRESQGTDKEGIACAVSWEVHKWEICSQEEMTWNVENLIFSLESSIPRVPANQHIFDRIQQIREQKDIPKQYGMVSVLIPLIPKLCMEQKIDSMEKKLNDIIIHFSESHTDLTISLGVDFYGNGIKVTKTIPLQNFSDNEKGEMEEKIQGTKGIKLSSLSATLVSKIKGHLF